MNAFSSKRIWSFWEMINFQVSGLCSLLKQLATEERDMAGRVSVHDIIGSPPPPFGGIGALGTGGLTPTAKTPYYVTEEDRQRITEWLQYAIQMCDWLSLTASRHRVDLFAKRLEGAMQGADYIADVRALREAIEGELNHIYFYHYPPQSVHLVMQFETTWDLIAKQFPSAKGDAFAAVDCQALGHGTASVFHSMRVAECGLRALARERAVRLPKNKPLEWADWQNIIEGITKKVDQIGNRKAGKARDAALEFYRGALGEFQAFKDVYRNNVMHTRRSYDVHQARSVLFHVYEFMNRLAAKIGENPKAIRWGKMP
jgi:hypothetical protein